MGLKRLDKSQIEQYERSGYLVIENVLDKDEIDELRLAIDGFVEIAADKTTSDGVYKLEPGHTKERPLLGRVVCPSLQHNAFWKLQRHPIVLDILQDLLGDSFRYMEQDKLNMKLAHVGSHIKWHQDWAFYPHTNDSVLAVCALIDNSTTENGCLQVVPGSHREQTYSHSIAGRFVSHMTEHTEFQPSQIVNLEAPAGSVTIHHARLIHGSQANTSPRHRRATCNVYCSADAWPLLGVAGPDFSNVGRIDWDYFCSTMLRGEVTPFPRLKNVPVRMPLPLDEKTDVFLAGAHVSEQLKTR